MQLHPFAGNTAKNQSAFQDLAQIIDNYLIFKINFDIYLLFYLNLPSKACKSREFRHLYLLDKQIEKESGPNFSV
jgi:hypothetical protein